MTSQRGGVDGGLGLVGNGCEEAGHGGAEERAMTGSRLGLSLLYGSVEHLF